MSYVDQFFTFFVLPCEQWVTIATIVNYRQHYTAHNMSHRYCLKLIKLYSCLRYLVSKFSFRNSFILSEKYSTLHFSAWSNFPLMKYDIDTLPDIHVVCLTSLSESYFAPYLNLTHWQEVTRAFIFFRVGSYEYLINFLRILRNVRISKLLGSSIFDSQ